MCIRRTQSTQVELYWCQLTLQEGLQLIEGDTFKRHPGFFFPWKALAVAPQTRLKATVLWNDFRSVSFTYVSLRFLLLFITYVSFILGDVSRKENRFSRLTWRLAENSPPPFLPQVSVAVTEGEKRPQWRRHCPNYEFQQVFPRAV